MHLFLACPEIYQDLSISPASLLDRKSLIRCGYLFYRGHTDTSNELIDCGCLINTVHLGDTIVRQEPEPCRNFNAICMIGFREYWILTGLVSDSIVRNGDILV